MWLAAVLLTACFVVPALGEGGGEIVRVAVIDYPNYLQMNEDGSVSGYAYEYLQDIKRYTGWQYEFVEMSFADATVALAQGTVDLVPGNQYTKERAELYDYSARDIGEGGTVLCIRPDDMRYCYNDYAGYDGMRIAALAGSIRMEQTRAKLAQYGATAVFVEYDTDEASKEALENGEVDAVLMSTIRCESKQKILARISTAPLYCCTNKQRPELKQALDAAIEELHLSSPYYEEKLDEKYYGSIPVQLAFTQAEKDYIASAETLTVAVSSDLVPVEYYDRDEQRYRGIVPDFFSLISDYSGLHFDFTTRGEMEALKGQMDAGEIQLVASVANEASIASKWNVELSDPYYYNTLTLIVNENVSDFKSTDGTVVLREGYPFLEQVATTEGYHNVSYAADFATCLSMVQNKRADMTLIPTNCADSLLRQGGYDHLSRYTVPDSYMDFCIGMSANADPLLLSVLNKSIAALGKDQQTALLVSNLTSVNEAYTLRNFWQANRDKLTMLALGVAVLLIAAISYAAISRQHANLRLRAALAKADTANQAKTEFLARMSHDMRTPMNGILGLCYLMTEQQDAAEIHKELPKLKESGEYLLQLINDVLDVNKVESGKMELHPKPCDEEQVFDSIIAMIKPQMEQKHIDFHFNKINIEWKYMLLDAQRVKQIFVNLLSNAAKFTPEGGRIDFDMELISEDKELIRDRFVIRDTGIGISEEFLPKVFLPFAQENRLQTGLGGTGLGLSIVKNLVELMGGTISVKSKVNEGTEFTLYLNFPLTERPAPPLEPTAPNTLAPSECLQGMKLLLCEDHPLNAQIAIRLLEGRGAQVTWRENGQLGADTFAATPDAFDAMLMDIRMPVMDGLTASRTIRAMDFPKAKTIPIIAMTANAYEEDVQKSLDAGMNAHLAKPIEPAKMFDTLVRLVRKQADEKVQEP